MRGYWNKQPGSYFGGGGSRGLTRGVKILLITNAVVYLIQQFAGHQFTDALGVTPTKVLQDLSIYQLVTYMFLHGSFFHILINMFILWMFGTEIERTWGIKRFLKYYLFTGIAGGIFTVAFQPNFTHPTIGASGAIYGLLVAYAVLFPNRTIYLYFLFPIKVKYAVVMFVVIEFLASLAATPDGVGHWAHLGGAVVGFFYVKADWRFRNLFRSLSPWHHWNRAKYSRKSRKLEKNREKAEEIMKRVDSILDKINEVGFENITEEERHFLEDASEILSGKDK
jgi:membrane associated rhomboid family serine protease